MDMQTSVVNLDYAQRFVTRKQMQVTAIQACRVVARPGSLVLAECATIFGLAGSVVHAAAGTTTYAKKDCRVYAKFASTTYARAGSIVNAEPGAVVYAEEGSIVRAQPRADVYPWEHRPSRR